MQMFPQQYGVPYPGGSGGAPANIPLNAAAAPAMIQMAHPMQQPMQQRNYIVQGQQQWIPNPQQYHQQVSKISQNMST
jgi:hypothetical protein